MKDKFIITISDIHGSKQYTLSQFIKVVASWIVIVIVILFLIGAMFLKYLSNHVETLEKDKKELILQKEILIKEIIKSQETLQAMDEQLKEAKKLIGLEADENSTVVVEQTQEKDDTKEENTTIDIGEGRNLTQTEYNLLTSLIPNGKPLSYRRISTKFGFRIHPITKRKQLHSALDLAANTGTHIFAPADGVVVYAGKKRFYGNFLLIRHGLGFETAYGHLYNINVKTGDYVKKGEYIAQCGNTGRSTGPHLHYEVRYLSKWLDPEPFMKEWSFEGYKNVMQKNKIVKWDSLINELRKEIKTIKENKGE